MSTENQNNFSVHSTLRKGNSIISELPFKNIKESILGKDYDLSLVFIGDKRSRTLNQNFRNKDKTSNVLSFPLTEKEGEIFINIRQAERECVRYEMKIKKFIAYLFIHGLLHLKGMKHSSRMEEKERLFLKKFEL